MIIIFFGSRSSEIHRAKIEETCTKCGTKNSLEAVVFQQLAHVFYAPIAPVGKTGYIYCKNCYVTVSQERLNPHFRNLYLEVQSKVKTPWWAFAGTGGFVLFLIIIFTAVGILTNISAKRVKEYVNSPQEMDLYEVETPDHHYTLYSVISVSVDSVYFVANKYETTEKSGLTGLRKEMYNPEIYSISRNDVINKYNTGEIFHIERESQKTEAEKRIRKIFEI